MKIGIMEGFRMHRSQIEYGLTPDDGRVSLFPKAGDLGFQGIEFGIGLDYKEDPLDYKHFLTPYRNSIHGQIKIGRDIFSSVHICNHNCPSGIVYPLVRSKLHNDWDSLRALLPAKDFRILIRNDS